MSLYSAMRQPSLNFDALNAPGGVIQGVSGLLGSIAGARGDIAKAQAQQQEMDYRQQQDDLRNQQDAQRFGLQQQQFGLQKDQFEFEKAFRAKQQEIAAAEAQAHGLTALGRTMEIGQRNADPSKQALTDKYNAEAEYTKKRTENYGQMTPQQQYQAFMQRQKELQALDEMANSPLHRQEFQGSPEVKHWYGNTPAVQPTRNLQQERQKIMDTYAPYVGQQGGVGGAMQAPAPQDDQMINQIVQGLDPQSQAQFQRILQSGDQARIQQARQRLLQMANQGQP